LRFERRIPARLRVTSGDRRRLLKAAVAALSLILLILVLYVLFHLTGIRTSSLEMPASARTVLALQNHCASEAGPLHLSGMPYGK
jgi:hypothetical protein